MAVPSVHRGVEYRTFLATLARKRQIRSYVEIGVHDGANLSQISCETAVGVDPDFRLAADVTTNKTAVHLFRTTSDAFFAGRELDRIGLSGRIDLAFLDGMHLFEFLLRDFYNIEACCRPDSVVALHDCLPTNHEMTERQHRPAARRDQQRRVWWTGDVWKTVAILREVRPDLRVIAVDCPPTGLVLIGRLDPGSTVLKDRYYELVDRFRRLDAAADLDAFFESIVIVPSADLLDEHDLSLFLRP